MLCEHVARLFSGMSERIEPSLGCGGTSSSMKGDKGKRKNGNRMERKRRCQCSYYIQKSQGSAKSDNKGNHEVDDHTKLVANQDTKGNHEVDDHTKLVANQGNYISQVHAVRTKEMG